MSERLCSEGCGRCEGFCGLHRYSERLATAAPAWHKSGIRYANRVLTHWRKKLDAAVADAHGGPGPLVDVSAVEEVIDKLGFSDQIRGFAVKIDKHPHRPGVAFWGAVAHSGKL